MRLILLLISILALTIDAKPSRGLATHRPSSKNPVKHRPTTKQSTSKNPVTHRPSSTQQSTEWNNKNKNLIYGDILMTPKQMFINQLSKNVRMFLFINENSYNRWPGNMIPYEFTSYYNDEEKLKIREALDEIEEKTCFRFVGRTYEPDYIQIQKLDGCYSYLGLQSGPQTMSLAAGCLESRRTIQHEFMHAMGIDHEHQRPDRDDYIRINWENVDPEWIPQLEKVNENNFETSGFQYDIKSVMHYFGTAGSIDGQAITMEDIQTGEPIAYNTELTEGDVQKIQFIGKC